MKVTSYVTNPTSTKESGLTLHFTPTEAKRIRAALGELDDDDLRNYGGILEALRCAIPQQWG